MSFTKKQLQAKYFCVIDIGSYKLRFCAAKFKNNKIEILGYKEKRQDTSNFVNNECHNLPGLCENIVEGIGLLERETGIAIKDIVVNYPFGEIYVATNSISHKRKNPHAPIESREFEEIVQKIEKKCIQQLHYNTQELYGLSSNETQILMSRVNSIHADHKKVRQVLGKSCETLQVSLLNALIPRSKYSLLTQMGNVIGKNIYRILPNEYAMSKIFPQSDILIINLGATQTTLTLKIGNEVKNISKMSIGIHHLISKISKKHKVNTTKVIENIKDSGKYQEEKKHFLSIWGESLGITLSEMLLGKISPRSVYLGGGGGVNNEFIRDYLSTLNLQKFDIKHLGNFEIVSEDMAKVFPHFRHISIHDIQTLPLDMYVLLLETNHVVSHEGDFITLTLQSAIKKLGFTYQVS